MELKNAPGLDIHWLVCTKEVSRRQEVAAWNQTFHLIPRWKLSAEILSAYQRERHLLASVLRSLKPALVHGWGMEEGYALAATDWSGRHQVSVQGVLTECCRVARQPILTRIQAFHERRALRRATDLTVESEWGRERLRQLAPQARIRQVEYGVNPECFDVTRNPAELPLALFVGTLSRAKGVDTLLKAFSDPRLHHVDLVLLGDGGDIASGNLPPNVRAMGRRPHGEVFDWMSKAWVLVHPTLADTSPNAVKEARVIGLPVVTTKNGGQTRYVEDGLSGVMHPAGDVEALIAGVLLTTTSRDHAISRGRHGQTACRKALHPSQTAGELIRIFEDLAGA
jgi:glycosyltransferase involved in cell wall biosynthesis